MPNGSNHRAGKKHRNRKSQESTSPDKTAASSTPSTEDACLVDDESVGDASTRIAGADSTTSGMLHGSIPLEGENNSPVEGNPCELRLPTTADSTSSGMLRGNIPIVAERNSPVEGNPCELRLPTTADSTSRGMLRGNIAIVAEKNSPVEGNPYELRLPTTVVSTTKNDKEVGTSSLRARDDVSAAIISASLRLDAVAITAETDQSDGNEGFQRRECEIASTPTETADYHDGRSAGPKATEQALGTGNSNNLSSGQAAVRVSVIVGADSTAVATLATGARTTRAMEQREESHIALSGPQKAHMGKPVEDSTKVRSTSATLLTDRQWAKVTRQTRLLMDTFVQKGTGDDKIGKTPLMENLARAAGESPSPSRRSVSMHTGERPRHSPNKRVRQSHRHSNDGKPPSKKWKHSDERMDTSEKPAPIGRSPTSSLHRPPSRLMEVEAEEVRLCDAALATRRSRDRRPQREILGLQSQPSTSSKTDEGEEVARLKLQSVSPMDCDSPPLQIAVKDIPVVILDETLSDAGLSVVDVVESLSEGETGLGVSGSEPESIDSFSNPAEADWQLYKTHRRSAKWRNLLLKRVEELEAKGRGSEDSDPEDVMSEYGPREAECQPRMVRPPAKPILRHLYNLPSIQNVTI